MLTTMKHRTFLSFLKNPFTFSLTSITVTNADRRSVCGVSKTSNNNKSTFRWSVLNILNMDDCVVTVFELHRHKDFPLAVLFHSNKEL